MSDGNIFQKSGGGGITYDFRTGTSGHFFAGVVAGVGGGKSTCVLGRSHFATVSQLKGIPILTLPAPEDGYGISCQTKYHAKYHLLT